MQSKIVHLIPVLIVLAIGTFVSAPSASAQPCQLGLNVSYAPIQNLSLSDIDFEHFESRNLLFTVIISNTGTPATAKLHGILHVSLSDGTYNGDAVDFETVQFPVPGAGKQFTNLNLGYNAEIKMDHLDFASEAKDKVQDVALATGKFPAGIYTLNILLDETGCTATGDTVVGTKQIEFDLTNPSRIELRSPRDGEVTSEFPFFEFYTDHYPVTLTVTEIGPGQSREDAIQQQPPMLETEIQAQNAFLYAGGRPLERGKSYAWRVKTSTIGSGGSAHDVVSTVGLFTVASTPGEGEASTEDAILRQLEELFGGRYPSLFQSIKNGHLSLDGTFSLNQSPLTESQLLDLLLQLRDISDSVDLTLE